MKLKFKLLSLFMILVLAVGAFAACAKKDADSDSTENTENTDDKNNESSDPYKNMNAIEFTEAMGNGINLGNTMEAYGHSSHGIDAPVSVYETLWNMPVTTEEMIQGMKDAGFDTLRIPVAWTNMMDFENDDYTINQAYIERVGEIIQYAIDADMIVIVNDHWDGGWWGMFGSADEKTREKAMTLYTEMWTQIANAYKNFDSHLVFESANEELGPRLNDTDMPWSKDGGKLSEDEYYAKTNDINQKFVDVVRAAGGNNENRFLLIAGINTNIAKTLDDRFKMPTDTVDGKLIVSVHYYDPSAYCIEDGISSWGTAKDVEGMNETLATLTEFTDAGYGVIIGEWGVLIEGKTELKKNTMDYYKNFIANCEFYGYCPVLWDCNSIYNRNECKIAYEEIATFFKDKSYSKVQKDVDKEEIKALAKRYLNETLKNAPSGEQVPEDEARAWIMWNSSDYSITYKVGDAYPDGQTEGLVSKEAKIEGPGTYTVGLDFTGTAAGKSSGIAFSALGIIHGETLFPGHFIEIKEVRINGEVVTLEGKPYTTSDDKICTRANIYNAWVPAVPPEARVADGDLSNCTPTPINGTTIGDIMTIEIDFEFVAP